MGPASAQNVTDMPRPGLPSVREEDVQTMNTLVLGLGSALPPPYYPDLSLCSSDLVPKMKEPLRGTCFCTKCNRHASAWSSFSKGRRCADHERISAGARRCFTNPLIIQI